MFKIDQSIFANFSILNTFVPIYMWIIIHSSSAMENLEMTRNRYLKFYMFSLGFPVQ